MAKVTVEIEIPDGHEVVDEPQMVEWSNTVAGKVRSFAFRVTARPVKPLIICGKPADWPEWLICDWIAKDRDDLVCGYLNEPQKYGDYERWFSYGIQIILSNRIDIDIPGPWEQSKRENPRRKK